MSLLFVAHMLALNLSVFVGGVLVGVLISHAERSVFSELSARIRSSLRR